jgi:trigger factor
MQVTETLSEGLKRGYKVVVPAQELATKLDAQLADLKNKVKINGFRPGKVPTAHLRRLYGKSVMAEIVQETVTEANRKIVEDNGLRLAQEPKIDFPTDQAEVERALEAQGDLAYSVNLEILPKFDIGTFEDISLDRKVTPVPDAEVEQALRRMADNNRTFTVRDEGAAAEKGDKVAIDFTGRIDGEVFEGGTGTDIDVILGSDTFIPGFEDQLVGIKAGEQRVVKVSFPEAYAAPALAGKAAEFDVTAKAIFAPGEVELNDEFAKGFGFDEFAKLQDAVRANIESDYARASRDKLKRALLDVLDKRYSFELPPSLVEQEFDNIWKQVEGEQQQSGKSFADENTTEEAARADYRRIAERRVRLGLLLAEVGEQAKVQVTDEELSKSLVERARQFPGQEQAIWDYYRKNPEALASLRAPIFEEKVVDHIIAQAKVSDSEVSKEELFKLEDETPAA